MSPPKIIVTKSTLRKILDWSIPALFILIGLGVMLYGIKAPALQNEAIKKSVSRKTIDRDRELIEAWDRVDDYLADCTEIGRILRLIESRGEYKYRLYLVVPQAEAQAYVVANDGGVCWQDGEPERPVLQNPAQLDRILDSGNVPGDLTEPPFKGLRGKWNIMPVTDLDGTLFGFLLVSHIKER